MGPLSDVGASCRFVPLPIVFPFVLFSEYAFIGVVPLVNFLLAHCKDPIKTVHEHNIHS